MSIAHMNHVTFSCYYTGPGLSPNSSDRFLLIRDFLLIFRGHFYGDVRDFVQSVPEWAC